MRYYGRILCKAVNYFHLGINIICKFAIRVGLSANLKSVTQCTTFLSIIQGQIVHNVFWKHLLEKNNCTNCINWLSGLGDLQIVQRRLTAAIYRYILGPVMIPLVEEIYSRNYIFQHEHESIHKIRIH